MAIEPFNYQKRTNIEEHNQIVDKLNEVVDAVNNIDPSGQGLEPRVSALETDVTDLGTRVDSVESKNTQQDTEIGNIKTDAETTNNRLGAAEGNITTLTGQVNQLETDTTSLDGRVTDIDGRLTTLAGNYTTLGGRVDSLDSQVGQLNTQVGGLETGKVNADQGVANAGKVLGIGADGRVTPVEQSGGGGGETRVSGTFTSTEFAQKVVNGEIKCGDCIHTTLNTSVSRINSASLFTLDQSTNLRCLTSIGTTTSLETTEFDFVITTSKNDKSYITLCVTPTIRRYAAGFSVTINSESISYGLHHDIILDSVKINKSTNAVELIYKMIDGASFLPNKNIVNSYIVIKNTSLTQATSNNFDVNMASLP